MRMPFADETLNAFVDQQLTPGEMEEVFEAARQDASFAQRICAMRQLKSMVKHAYDGIEPPRSAKWRAAGRNTGVQAVAAVLLLGMGGLAGWYMHPGESGNILPPKLANSGLFIPASLNSESEDGRIILHLDSDNPERMTAVLDYADRILVNAKKEGKQAELEIVANNYGLNLLREGHNIPYRARIQELANKHGNLKFIACGQAVARYKREGKDVTLIEEASMVPSVIGEVVSKMKEGWTYIRV